MRHKARMKNEVWGLDFIHDTTVSGRSLKMLVVLDEYTRECLAIELDRTFRGADVVAVLEELTAEGRRDGIQARTPPTRGETQSPQ
jgi:hypothetical protein